MAERVFIVPHTHWDREWYLPFQRFRYNLVRLIDSLIDIMHHQDFRFMLDGQTVVLEDYLEVRPEKRDDLLRLIRAGKIVAGPWYLLPDEWLVGGESLIRNLEMSLDLARELQIPLMRVAYLPDQFGHTSAIPQLIHDLTDFRAAFLWRGVPHHIRSTVFTWKSSVASAGSLMTIYMPHGYGNAARLPDQPDAFRESIAQLVHDLRPFSPLPVFLLMNGSDHLFPQPFVEDLAQTCSSPDREVKVGSLEEYLDALEASMGAGDFSQPVYSGEMRSPARAPMLQDTYSSRMWIKQWNQRVEDLLTTRVEPLCALLWSRLRREYPDGFLRVAWRWLLQNQPHDSICGCSVDQTHEEMRSRFSWSQSIGEAIVDDVARELQSGGDGSDGPAKSTLLAFHAGPTATTLTFLEFSLPRGQKVQGLREASGRVYPVQVSRSYDRVYLDTTLGVTAAKMALRLLSGRKLMDFYVNGVEYHDSSEPGMIELRIEADERPVGEFDIERLKRDADRLLKSGKYKKIHVVAARTTQDVYCTALPLRPWAVTRLEPVAEEPPMDGPFEVSADRIANRFYTVTFNRDGSMRLVNWVTNTVFERLHYFEDLGDRGDEYTFSKVGPDHARVRHVKRRVKNSGPVLAEIEQELFLETPAGLDQSRERRMGLVRTLVRSTFRFYRGSPRIEVTTSLTNVAHDHRLRVCFDLPYASDQSVTSTHFGVIMRRGDPEPVPDETVMTETGSSYPERPSGIQAQKRFIRVNDPAGRDALTVFNRGLPEVELVGGRRICLTLLRCVGWLSRSDFPERPMHAGPAEPTPGAQELGVHYEFHYGLLAHTADTPIHAVADEAEAAFSEPVIVVTSDSALARRIDGPLVESSNPAVRISSVRVRDNALLVTMFNMTDKDEVTELRTTHQLTRVDEVRVDGAVKREHGGGTVVRLEFRPREIKMCRLS